MSAEVFGFEASRSVGMRTGPRPVVASMGNLARPDDWRTRKGAATEDVIVADCTVCLGAVCHLDAGEVVGWTSFVVVVGNSTSLQKKMQGPGFVVHTIRQTLSYTSRRAK
jgi:hypothetical protein